MYMYAYRNVMKKAKTTRHEKAYMQQLRCAGATVGEYIGNGQGETERTETKDGAMKMLNQLLITITSEDTSVGSNDDANPLLILYDCETTGFSIYCEHITEIAAKVVGVPLSFSQLTFSSLVKTSRNISKKGMQSQIHFEHNIISCTCLCINCAHAYMYYLIRQVSQPPSYGKRSHCQRSYLSF